MKHSKIKNILQGIKHFKGNRSFSETGEDTILRTIFRGEVGHYIDVGAQHPIFGSNSLAFYRSGWRGLVIEPQERFNFLWKFFRPKDSLRNLIISDTFGEIQFAEFENSLISSGDESIVKKHIARGQKPVFRNIRTVPLSSLIDSRIEPTDPCFLSIDVEGMEYQVLKSLDFSKHQPRAIVLETWSYPWETKTEGIKYLESTGLYELYAYSGLSAVYVNAKWLREFLSLRSFLSS